MNELEYVKKELEKSNYTILPKESTIGPVYKVHECGSLQTEGYEFSYIYLPAGSGIKFFENSDFAQKDTVVSGELNKKGRVCESAIYHVNQGYRIDPVEEDTIVSVCQIAAKYLPILNGLSYSQLKQVFANITKKRNFHSSLQNTTYDAFALSVIFDKENMPHLVDPNCAIKDRIAKDKSPENTYYYDVINDTYVQNNTSCPVPLSFILKSGNPKRKKAMTKKEILAIWNVIALELSSLALQDNINGLLANNASIANIDISNLFITKDVNRRPRLCTIGPNHTFKAFIRLNLDGKEDRDPALGWCEDAYNVLRLSDLADALKIPYNPLCSFEEVINIWAMAQEELPNFTFENEKDGLWEPYSRKFTYNNPKR